MANHPNRAKRKAPAASQQHDHDYSALLTAVTNSFDSVITDHAQLFLTDVEGLNDLYLDLLAPEQRQMHNCSACRRFIGTYGKIAAVGNGGDLIPAMWSPDQVPEFYRAAFEAMAAKVRRARIKSVFASKTAVWGQPVTGDWRHMAVLPPAAMIHRDPLRTPDQVMAVSRHRFQTVAAALSELAPPLLDEALRILEADALSRSERFVGPVRWLRALHDRPKGRAGENLLWRAVASAPEGYCHPRASIIAPLLDGIAAGLPFAHIKARFEAKVHPLIYQRPQAAPRAGAIREAEATFAKLGLAPALERRFAILDEVIEHAIWAPAQIAESPAKSSIFGHLKPKDDTSVRPVDLPWTKVTWDKFSRTILPKAERIEVLLPRGNGPFIALTTAVYADAPPLFKWNNHVAWYVYPGGSPAHQWRLMCGTWAKANAIVPLPTLWDGKSYLGDGMVIVLDGAVDTKTGSGNALFPDCIREDLHGVRSVIEAYSRTAELTGREFGSACGFDLRKGGANCFLRVFAAGAWTPFHIDRWD